jgi:hypothetical protein
MTRTSCPNRQVLLDYHTGKLREAVAKGVIAHINSCSTCQTTLKTFGDSADSLVARLRRAKPEDPYAREPQRQQMLDRVRAVAETIVLRETPPGHVATEPVALGSLGDYELLQKLGEGGMGAVYKARHTRLDKLVALKVLPADTMRDPDMVARFEREMKAVGRLEHPHIVRAMDAGEVGGRHYLAIAVRDVCRAAGRPAVSPGRLKDSHNMVPGEYGLLFSVPGFGEQFLEPGDMMASW